MGVVEPDNRTVNTRSMCQAIERRLRARGAEVRYGRTVSRVVAHPEHGVVTGVMLDDGELLEADVVVLAAGFETTYLMRDLGLRLPLQAVKAYSLHITAAAGLTRALPYATHLAGGSPLEPGVACLVTPYLDSQPAAVRVTGFAPCTTLHYPHETSRVAVERAVDVIVVRVLVAAGGQADGLLLAR